MYDTQVIKVVDIQNIGQAVYSRAFACSIIVTKEQRILLQLRDKDKSFAGCISTFGGNIESGEEPIQALVRELKEELGAKVITEDVIFLGAITEAITNHSEILYVHFWHDRHGTITGCYEGAPLYFDSIASVKEYPKVMDYVLWSLDQCSERRLLIQHK